MNARPLSASQARLRANGMNGRHQTKYHGFWVGKSNQNQASVKNAASKTECEESVIVVADIFAPAHKASRHAKSTKAAVSKARVRMNGDRVAGSPQYDSALLARAFLHHDGLTVNQAT